MLRLMRFCWRLMPFCSALVRPVVLRHVLLFTFLDGRFTLFQIAGLLCVQRTVLKTIGDAVLLVLFTLVDFIHSRMSGINHTWASAGRGSVA